VHDFPANPNVVPRLVLPSSVLQPQTTLAPALARDTESRGVFVLGSTRIPPDGSGTDVHVDSISASAPALHPAGNQEAPLAASEAPAPAQAAAPTDPVPSAAPASTASSSALAPEQNAPHTRLSSGIHKPKIYIDDTIRYANLVSSDEPCNLHAALDDPKWQEAMMSEFSAPEKNKTWHLVPPVSGHNLIDSNYVYKIKRKVDGSIDRYKARLVAKSFKQR
jgi:hypothetical protein